MKNLFLSFTITFFLISCGGSDKNEPIGLGNHDKFGIKFIQLDYCEMGCADIMAEEHFEVIRTQERFNELYRRYERHQGIEKPKIDFNNEMILYYSRGGFTTNGYDTNIKSITKTKDLLIVNIENTNPNDKCKTTNIITEPRVFAKISNKYGDNITYKTKEIYKCD